MNDLCIYRLNMANEQLKSAKALLDIGQYRDSIGRSYYAIFSSTRALLATEQIDFKKHSAVISYFQKNYIKTRKFDIKYSDFIQNAFQIRNSCDYDEFYIASKDEAEEQYAHAEEFYQGIKLYVENLV